MGYGVTTTWALQRGPAQGAGSSRKKTTRTAKRRSSASVRRAKKKSRATTSKRRSLPPSQAQEREQGGIGNPPRGWAGTRAQYKTFLAGGPGYWY